jgi:hypothetical protein
MTFREGVLDNVDRMVGLWPNGIVKIKLSAFDSFDDKIMDQVFFVEIKRHVNSYKANDFERTKKHPQITKLDISFPFGNCTHYHIQVS